MTPDADCVPRSGRKSRPSCCRVHRVFNARTQNAQNWSVSALHKPFFADERALAWRLSSRSRTNHGRQRGGGRGMRAKKANVAQRAANNRPEDISRTGMDRDTEKEKERGGGNEKGGGKTSEEREEGKKEVMRMERKKKGEAVDSGPVDTYRGIFTMVAFFF